MPIPQYVVQCDIEAVYLNEGCGQVLHVPEDVHEKDVVRGDGGDPSSLDLNIVPVVQPMNLLVKQVHLNEKETIFKCFSVILFYLFQNLSNLPDASMGCTCHSCSCNDGQSWT